MKKQGKNRERGGKNIAKHIDPTFKKLTLKVRWREAIALNYEVDRQLLLESIPPGLVIDSYHDRTYVTLLAINLYELHPYGGKLALFRSVDWISLRTYVRSEKPLRRSVPPNDHSAADSQSDLQRGFLTLRNFVSSRPASFFLRFLIGDRFARSPIKRTTQGFLDTRRGATPSAEYSWISDGNENLIKVKGRAEVRASKDNNKTNFFLLHRNWFIPTRKGTMVYEIRQAPWLVWDAAAAPRSISTPLTFWENRSGVTSEPVPHRSTYLGVAMSYCLAANA